MNTKSISGVLVFALVTTLAIATAQTSKPASSLQSARTPSEVAAHFFEAVTTGRVDDAVALMAPFPDVPREVMEEVRKDVAGPWRTQPHVVGHLQIGTSAVVIFHDSSPNKRGVDLDPAYMIRRDATWYVLPQITEFESRWFPLDEPTTKSLEELKVWFRSQKPGIAEMLAGE